MTVDNYLLRCVASSQLETASYPPPTVNGIKKARPSISTWRTYSRELREDCLIQTYTIIIIQNTSLARF